MAKVPASLYQQVESLKEEFLLQVNENIRYSLQSRPHFVYFYNDLADHFREGIKVCCAFFEKPNLNNLVRGLIKYGFYSQAVSLKSFVNEDDVDTLEILSDAERELEELQFEYC